MRDVNAWLLFMLVTGSHAKHVVIMSNLTSPETSIGKVKREKYVMIRKLRSQKEILTSKTKVGKTQLGVRYLY